MSMMKWLIMFIVSISVGTFVDESILEKMNINVWLSRGIGCLIAVIIALTMYHYLLEKKDLQTD